MSRAPASEAMATPSRIRFRPPGSRALHSAAPHEAPLNPVGRYALPPTAPHEARVWHTSTELPTHRARELESLLTHAELQRAARFRFHADRQRFVIGRGMVRTLLAASLGVSPADVPIETDERGRPRVRASDGIDIVHFSVSHAGEHVVVAHCEHHEVGVDVELLRDDPSLQELVAHAFTPAERDALAHYSGQDWLAAVYSIWTRKEAVVKALGVGLEMPLTAFDVTVDPAAEVRVAGSADPRPDRFDGSRGAISEPRVLRSSDPRLIPAEWKLYDLQLPTGAAGTLAVRGSGVDVSAWEFS